MAVVLPHGVLFRGSSEGVIRQYLIEKMNVVDTIIGLPANIFYGTSIPTCILVLKKNRTIQVIFCSLMLVMTLKSRRTKTSYCLSISIRSLQLLNSVRY
jgi:type I restriction-modification system DNA methylase subunit